MISPEESERMRSQLEGIRAEIGVMNARLKELTATVAVLEKKLL